MKINLYAIQSWDLVKKFELTIAEENVERLSIMDVSKIFKNARKKYTIQGKAFLFRYKDQMFFIAKIKDDFKIYALE